MLTEHQISIWNKQRAQIHHARKPREIFRHIWQYMHYYVLLFKVSNSFAIRIKGKYVLWLSLWISSSTVSSQIFIFFSADSKLISTTYRNFSMTLFLSHSLCEIDFTEKSLNRTHTCPLHNQLRGNDVNWPEIKAIWKATVHGQAARILKKKNMFLLLYQRKFPFTKNNMISPEDWSLLYRWC